MVDLRASLFRTADSSLPALQAKWGPRQEGQHNCEIEVKEPITGNMTLPQKPFGNLAYLQRFWVQEDPYFTNIPILAGLSDQKRKEKDRPKTAAAPLKNLRKSPIVKGTSSGCNSHLVRPSRT